MAYAENKIIEEAGICKVIRQACIIGEKARKNGEGEQVRGAKLFNSALEQTKLVCPAKKCLKKEIFAETLGALDTFLMNAEVKQEFREALTDVQEERKALLESIDLKHPFPTEERAIRYLEKYRRLLRLIYSYIDVFEDFYGTSQKFLLDILNMDICCDGSKMEMRASLYSPVALEGLLQLYNEVEQYMEQAIFIEEKEDVSRLLRSNYQGVIISKALRHFRWIVTDGKELFQAAIPAALPISEGEEGKGENEQRLDIPVRYLRDYSSYEGVGELRLFDKIVYELEQDDRGFPEDGEIHILIIGDLLQKPIAVLSQAVENYVEKKPEKKRWENLRIQMTILTRNYWEEDQNNKETSQRGMVRYVRFDYEGQLRSGEELDKLLEENDLIFLLDCCDLYQGIAVKEQDEELVRRQLSDEKDFSIVECQQMLYALAYSGTFGSFSKEINKTLFQYMENKIKDQSNRKRKKTVYIYVSDMTSISGLDYSDKHFIRLERYNEKEILILRMSELEEKPLPEKSDRKMIVLNLWQVINHCIVRIIDCFLLFFDIQNIADGIRIFRQTLIGVEYEYWKKELKFYFYISRDIEDEVSEHYRDQLCQWIKIGIMPYFKKKEGNIFYQYFVKAFSSFLYSDTKNIDDMLFLHLYDNRRKLLGNPVFEGGCSDVVNYQSKKCKYSQKQFYLMVMEDYDTSSEMFMYKYRKLNLMERADFDLRKTIFPKVMAACERNGYQDSYLYLNCQKMT